MMGEGSKADSGIVAWLRAEGFVVAAAATIAYAVMSPAGWLFFAAFFLVPDVSFLGYLAGPRRGALIYNLAHSYVSAGILVGIGLIFGGPVAVAAGLVWVAHIGFDRFLGYGLKLPGGFRNTHLGVIGRAAMGDGSGDER